MGGTWFLVGHVKTNGFGITTTFSSFMSSLMSMTIWKSLQYSNFVCEINNLGTLGVTIVGTTFGN